MGVRQCLLSKVARLNLILKNQTSSYPGWIKSPHVVTLGILKISDLDSLTIFMGGYSGVNFGHPESEVF